MPRILGIESSCDECSASIVEYAVDPITRAPHSFRTLSLTTFSQTDIHEPYGGVVPEVASRNHLETINWVLDKTFKDAGLKSSDLDAIAVTNRPGLVGALLVGVTAAKALAWIHQKPLIDVHHLEGHALSILLDRETSRLDLPTPTLIAVASGGHTHLHLAKTAPHLWPLNFLETSTIGRSRDDAAGEAFDKTAKLMGFPYPGGVWIDRTAQGGNSQRFAFPRALPQKATFDFSFSGLKTAAALEIEKLKKAGTFEKDLPDLCASLQEAIVDALLTKIRLAIETHRCRALAFVGGVAANSRLRARLDKEWRTYGLEGAPIFPHAKYCTDNAAMIAVAGAFRFEQGHALSREAMLTLNANPRTESIAP